MIKVMLALGCLAAAHAVHTGITHMCRLSDWQVVPRVSSTETGIALFDFNRKTKELTYHILHTKDTISFAKIHAGRAGQNGAVLDTLDHSSNPIKGVWTLNSEHENQLLTGNMHLVLYAGGVYQQGMLRCQIEDKYAHTLNFSPLLQPTPPEPLPLPGYAWVQYSTATEELHYYLVHSLQAISVHIHGPAANGRQAGVVATLAASAQETRSPISGKIRLNPRDTQHLLSGRFYINLHTDDAPNGALRANIPPPTSYYAAMTREQEVADDGQSVLQENGVAAVVLMRHLPPVNHMLVSLVHTLGLPSFDPQADNKVDAGHLHLGEAGKNGAAMLALPSTKSSLDLVVPLEDSLSETPSLSPVQLLVEVHEQRCYVNLHTSSQPSGELRGQVLTVREPPSLGLTSDNTDGSAAPSASSRWWLLCTAATLALLR